MITTIYFPIQFFAMNTIQLNMRRKQMKMDTVCCNFMIHTDIFLIHTCSNTITWAKQMNPLIYIYCYLEIQLDETSSLYSYSVPSAGRFQTSCSTKGPRKLHTKLHKNQLSSIHTATFFSQLSIGIPQCTILEFPDTLCQ